MIRFEPCQMDFNELNMLQYCYSVQDPDINQQAIVFSYNVMKKIEKYLKNDIVAIEMFYYNNTFYVNEIAPRVHNSGHHTIHAYSVSQFELAARLLMNYPIFSPDLLYDYMMYNVIGPENLYGPYAYYDNFPTQNKYDMKSYFIDYHKKETRPFRKMGHMTFLFYNPNNHNPNNHNPIDKKSNQLQSVKIIAPREKPTIGIIMGSKSDMKIMQHARDLLEQFQQPHEFLVVSAHRTPQRLYEYAEKAHERGLKVIIAGAGGAAHLPGMVASLTCVPVIGVPIKTETLNGLDSLYSIVQMPPNVPVACMAINGAQNAALYALQILANTDIDLFLKLQIYKTKIANNALL